MDPLVKEKLDLLLAKDLSGADPALAKRVADLVVYAYEGCDEEEWADLVERYRECFGLADDQALALLQEAKGGRAEPAPKRKVGEVVPMDFQEACRGTWLGDYLAWTAASEAPSAFHLGSILAAVSAGLPRAPRLEWEARETYPNLYVLLIGPAGSRKGSAVARAVGMASRALGIHVLGSDGTPQGYAAALRRRWESTKRMADGLIVAPEFSRFLGTAQSKALLVQWLTDWYDCPEVDRRELRSEPNYEIHNVYLSLLGASNLPWLRLLPQDAVSGGFLPRFLVFEAPGKRHWEPNPQFDPERERALTERLASVKTRGIPERLGFDKDALAWTTDWYTGALRAQYEAAHDEQFRYWLDRKQAVLFKVAVIWQLLDHGPLDALRAAWLDRARTLLDWMDSSVSRTYEALGVTREGEPMAAILDLLDRKGELGRRQIIRALRNRYSAESVRRALLSLRAGGEILVRMSSQEGEIYRRADESGG